MKESPILFSTEMVQATIDDRKTQTRRTRGLKVLNESPDDWRFKKITVGNEDKKEFFFRHKTVFVDVCDLFISCPYGQVGDLLWVRESFAPLGEYPNNTWMFKADVSREYSKWKPSIHMPKAAARIWLRITNIRVERLHDITEEDAIKEGVETLFEKSSQYYDPKAFKNYTWYGDNGNNSFSGYSGTDNAVDSFTSLWYKINGEESWNVNPWVWVIEFEVIYKTGKP